jgi:hypothetical protein
MQVSNWVIFGTAEVFAVLLVVCVFLLFHTRGLKSMVLRLQDRIQSLVADLKKAKAEILKAQKQSDPRDIYISQLDQLIDQTREFHSSLNPDRDIALDLSNDSPIPRQVAALRFASLVSEKEAVLASSSTTPNWVTLEDKYTQLINFFRSQSSATKDNNEDTSALKQELENTLQRVENLEKFKKLFFQMEDQWRDAKKLADEYYEQLSNINVDAGQKESFDSLLNNYNNVYNQVGQSIQIGTGAGADASVAPDNSRVIPQTRTITNTVEITKTDARTQNELRQLRNVAEEQHRVIHELQNRLKSATTQAEKDAVINDLQEQLERQIRFVQESETCIQLLENEVTQSNAQLQAVNQDKDELSKQLAEIPEMKSAIEKYTEESKEMVKVIDRLEQENRQLATQAEVSGSSDNTNSNVSEANQELAKLKQQYAELEARYLELRMQG